MSAPADKTLIHLLDLDGVRYVVDAHLGLWVKFEVKKVSVGSRYQGIRYSLTLHDRHNRRLMGFDNAHAVEVPGKRVVKNKRVYDHWHRDEGDEGRPYDYKDAAKLLEDFWRRVDDRIKKLTR